MHANVVRVAVLLAAFAHAVPAIAAAPRACVPVTKEFCDTVARSFEQASRQRETSASGDVERVTQSAEGVDRWQRASQACQTALTLNSPVMLEQFWERYGEAMGDTARNICDASPAQPPTPPPEEVAATPPSPLLLDADLGVPVGVHIGYAPSVAYWGLGVRAAVGPAEYDGLWDAAGIIGAFGEIPLDWQGIWRIEPSAVLAITGYGVGPMAGVNLHGAFSPDRRFSGGFRTGLNVGAVDVSTVTETRAQTANSA